jgi:hypothetical protein
MSLIRDKILYSRETLEEIKPSAGNHPNLGEYLLSLITTDPDVSDQVWLVNAGYDLSGVNRASCGKVLRRYGELEQLARTVGQALADLGVNRGSIVQVRLSYFTTFKIEFATLHCNIEFPRVPAHF